jgi:tetratricopeptide (TPR) repeat protein
MSVTAFADEPYESYNYDNWDTAIPSQSGYTVQKTVTGADMGLDRLSDPDDPLFYSEDASESLNEAKDFYVYDDSEIWIADTSNNRILRLNSDYQVIGRYYSVTGESELGDAVEKTEDGSGTLFKAPQGLYVTISPTTGKLTIYIADYDNSRVVRASVDSETELTLEQEYVKPEEALYTSKTFNPTKVLVDYAENVYTVVKSVNTGSVQFKADGSFTGFYGANRVEVTAKVIAQKLWRKIASNEQISGMTRNVPVEYANFDIDSDGFIYTVTEAANTTTDAIKKLNPAGYNIWDNNAGNEYTFGDVAGEYDSTTNQSYVTRLTDMVVGDNGVMNVLDFSTGRVFQYDREANLLCIFGTKNSTNDQEGSFSNPNAIEALGDKIYVLDGAKNDVTVFTETTFGSLMHDAVELYDQGRYSEAQPIWQEVVERDGGYPLAYIGLGKAALNSGEYYDALDYFKTAYDQDDYDKAFKYAREEFISDNFTVIIVIVIVLIVYLIVLSRLHKKNIYLIKGRIKSKKKDKPKEGV